MTERTFLAWLKKAGKKWKPFIVHGVFRGAIRLRAGRIALCPLEAVQALHCGEKPSECNYREAYEWLKIDFQVDEAADTKDYAIPNAQLRPKMLKALGLKEAR